MKVAKPIEVTSEQFANACYWLETQPELLSELLNMKIEYEVYQALISTKKTDTITIAIKSVLGISLTILDTP